MTWNPSNGFWSENTFESFGGTVSGNYVSVTGGFVQMLPIYNETQGFISSWIDYTGWSLTTLLSSRAVVTGTFNLYSGLLNTGEVGTQFSTQASIANGAAWRVESRVPLTVNNNNYSGVEYNYFESNSASNNTSFYDYFSNAGTTVTIEFDAASYLDIGNSSLSGFMSGQVSGLPPRSGLLNHGIYIDNGVYWDFLELSPYGLQSVNHPEIALPIDVSIPRRFRIGIDNQDLYLLADNGSSTVGLGKLDTPTTTTGNSARIAFGAPRITGENFDLWAVGVTALAGITEWSNFKLVTGELVLQVPTGIKQAYSTSTQTVYTEEFNPKITLQSFSTCKVDFRESNGGITTITPQYSGDSGWVDLGAGTDLTGTSPATLDLSTIPVYTYSRTRYGSDHLENPIRFKIELTSYGVSPPPAIDNLYVVCNHEASYLDLVPSWKASTTPTQVVASINNEAYYLQRPEVEQWTTFLYNSPIATGEVSGEFTQDDSNNLTISGEGEIVYNGRYNTAFKNYKVIVSTAAFGSDAYSYFGAVPTKNCYPNIFFDLPFVTLSTGYSGTSGPFAIGQIGSNCRVPSNNTGQYTTEYSKTLVSRLERQAETRALAEYYGLSTSDIEYAQRVHIYTSNATSDGTAGIDFIIPSGIATPSVLLKADVKINSGTGIVISATGDTDSSSVFIPNTYSDYFTVAYEANSSYSGEIAFQILAPNNVVLTEDIDFTVDNVQCIPLVNGYLNCNGVSTIVHRTGSVNESTPLLSHTEPQRGCTVMYGDFFIESLPKSGTAVLFERLRGDGKGVSVRVDSSGNVTATYDMYARARISGVTSNTLVAEEFLETVTITGHSTVPVGRWVNIGFNHQLQTAKKLSMADASINFFPYNLAMSNRCFLTFDGAPVASYDNMHLWKKHGSATNDPAPYVSYLASGISTVTAASGLRCLVDGLYISNPVTESVEVENSIRGAKNTGPYFVPDVFLKPNDVQNNVLVNPFATSNQLGNDLHIGSIYNFYSPGLTNWDHGSYLNHLLYYGEVTVSDTGNPYNIGGATRFGNGYAIAPYCSAFERLFNVTGHLGLPKETALATSSNGGTLDVMGWIKPHSTGEFFSIVENINNPTSGAFALSIDSNWKLRAERRANNGTIAWSFTGFSSPSGEWTFFRSVSQLGYYSGLGATGSFFTSFYPGSGSATGTPIITGENYGFKYWGQSGDPYQSAFYFGRTADVELCDFSINPYSSTFAPFNLYNGQPFYTGSKGGRFNTFIEGTTKLSQTGIFSSFTSAILNLPATSGATSFRNIWVASLDGYDSNPTFSKGIPLFDDEPFIEAAGYYITYDLNELYGRVGSAKSPITIGNKVPTSDINLAYLSNNDYSISNALSTLDFSSTNSYNLAIYNLGKYPTLSSTSITGSQLISSYRSINEELLSGKIDVTFLESSYTKDIELTNKSITDINLDRPVEAFYYYIIGNGEWAVKADGAFPHTTGLLPDSTGVTLERYQTNKSIVLNSISLKDSGGQDIPYASYPYNIEISNVSEVDYLNALASGDSIQVDGIGTLDATGSLPDGVFTVSLLLNSKVYLDTTSVWVYYKGYNLTTRQIENRREIVNAKRMFIEADTNKFIGEFTTSINTGSYQEYDITVYGLKEEYSGYYS